MAVLLHEANPPDTAGGRYVVLKNENGQAWNPNTNAEATYTTARDDFDVQATQDGSPATGSWRCQVPSRLPVKRWSLTWYKEAVEGVRDHAADERLEQGDGFWNGLRFTDGPEFFTTLSYSGSQLSFDCGLGPQGDGSLVGYIVRISSQTAGADGGFVSSLRRVAAHTYAADVHTITLDEACGFTISGGEAVEFYLPGGASATMVADEVATFSTTVDNTEWVEAFTAELGNRRDDVTIAWPVLNFRVGDELPLWVKCGKLTGGKWLERIANVVSSDTDAFEIIEDDGVPRVGVSHDRAVIWVRAVGADGATTADITFDGYPLGGRKFEGKVQAEIKSD